MRLVPTARQKVVLAFVRRFISDKGYAPTRVEIADFFEFTPNAAQCHLVALKACGLIEIDSRVARGIRVVREAA
jgi:repressor LexA